jgi:hypothetical protein
MVRTIASLVAVALALSVITAIAQDSDKEKKAVSAAEKWLSMVDEGKYSDSWQGAAEYLRNAISQEQWNRSLQAVRKPLGKIVSRQMKTATYRTSLPGAPDGEYVVIKFDTSFENKKAAIETVTPMMDQDGTWRVSGYYIK